MKAANPRVSIRHPLPLIVATALVLAITVACEPDRLDSITVGYLTEWPTANHVARVEKAYDDAMGVQVRWREFNDGNEMNDAMAAGEVQIAYSQGFVPWVVAVSNGHPFKVVGVAVSYAEADNCVAHADAGITQVNAHELEGKKVATPIGNVTHFKLLRTLQHLGVDANRVEIVEMNGADAADALERGEVAMACAFGGPLARMRELGNELMNASEQEAIGIRVFDVVAAPEEFVEEHPDLMREFLAVTERANAAYRADPSRYEGDISKAAGTDFDTTQWLLATFSFPTGQEQKSSVWMGDTVGRVAQEVAEFFVEQGLLQQALDSYGFAVDDRFL